MLEELSAILRLEEFGAVFEEAMRLPMRADVPVGCYLSGGLDSCAVLGFAARLCSTPIQAFTLTFDQAAYDEGDIALEMAARAGANFHLIPIKQFEIADNFRRRDLAFGNTIQQRSRCVEVSIEPGGS